MFNAFMQKSASRFAASSLMSLLLTSPPAIAGKPVSVDEARAIAVQNSGSHCKSVIS
jgi:hypothetical protein